MSAEDKLMTTGYKNLDATLAELVAKNQGELDRRLAFHKAQEEKRAKGFEAMGQRIANLEANLTAKEIKLIRSYLHEDQHMEHNKARVNTAVAAFKRLIKSNRG
jgi:hypothetical protein